MGWLIKPPRGAIALHQGGANRHCSCIGLPALKGVVAKLLLQETAQIHVFTVFLWFMAFLLVEVSRMVGLASLPLSGGTEGGCGSAGCCAEPTAGPSSVESLGFVWLRAAAAPSLLPR